MMYATLSVLWPWSFWLALAGSLLVFLPGCGADVVEKGGKELASSTAQPTPRSADRQPGAAAANAAATDRESHFHQDEIEMVAQTAAGSSTTGERTGEDWAEFLGPRGTGISGEQCLLERWPETGPNVLWKKKIGEGYSAPSVRGNRLVVFHRPLMAQFPGPEEAVDCLEADTGKPLWHYAYPTQYLDPYRYNGGPRCTPLLTDDRCYTFGAEGMLTCLNLLDGKRVWQRNTAEEFKIPAAFFGVGATPILEGNLLVVMVGGHPKSGMVAFDARTGKTVWQNVGPETYPDPPVRTQRDSPPAKLASYATPLAATIHGKRHVLCFMRPGLVSVDPESGEPNFSFWIRSPIHDSVNAARPIVVGDLVFLSAAYETGAALLKVHPDGKKYDVVWSDAGSRQTKLAKLENRIKEIDSMQSKTDEERQKMIHEEEENPDYADAMQNHWSTCIHHHGYLYGFSGRHEPGSTFRCIKLTTGKLQWQTHDFNANDEPDAKAGLGATEPKYYGRGSAILADGKFIVMGERGTLALVALNPREFLEISRIKYPEAGYPSWTAPVLSRQRLYLSVARETARYGHDYHLLCLDLAKQGGTP